MSHRAERDITRERRTLEDAGERRGDSGGCDTRVVPRADLPDTRQDGRNDDAASVSEESSRLPRSASTTIDRRVIIVRDPRNESARFALAALLLGGLGADRRKEDPQVAEA